MVEDVYREAKGEIVESKEVTIEQFYVILQNILYCL
jgi:hypothetical protein